MISILISYITRPSIQIQRQFFPMNFRIGKRHFFKDLAQGYFRVCPYLVGVLSLRQSCA